MSISLLNIRQFVQHHRSRAYRPMPVGPTYDRRQPQPGEPKPPQGEQQGQQPASEPPVGATTRRARARQPASQPSEPLLGPSPRYAWHPETERVAAILERPLGAVGEQAHTERTLRSHFGDGI